MARADGEGENGRAAPLSVAALARRIQGALAAGLPPVFWIAGEVVGARPASSGHVYLTLKDESGAASVDAVVYKIDLTPRARELLRDGARVVGLARVVFWVPRGRLQIALSRVALAGRGALLEALERLKAKLAAEGLFAAERKRPLPADPRVVGVVTSAAGTAIHDVAKVADRRGGARILLCPAQVQGEDAPRSIARAIELLSRVAEVDVVIVGRGGGSADDLAAWNDETVVRAIAASRAPVVSAVGHETDVTLADFAADARAATPSQAAEMVVPDRAARRADLAHFEARLLRAARARLVSRQAAAADLARRLSGLHPGAVLAARRGVVLASRERMVAAVRAKLAACHAELGDAAARLDAMSPLAVLARGYAIATTADGRAVRAAADVRAGDPIAVRVHEAMLEATVTDVRPTPREPGP